MENLRTNSRTIPRIGVIGCGNIGSRFDENKTLPYALSHCGAYQLLNIPITAMADPDEIRLSEAGKSRKVISLYHDAAKLIEKESIDILSICTPSHIRYPLIKKAVEQGVKVIICEKPLASTVEEAQKIKNLINHSTTQLLVNYSRRWDPTIQEIKAQIRSGEVGKIQHVSATYGKGLLNNGGHLINLLQYFFGNHYSTQYVRLLEDDLIAKDPTAHALLHCNSEFGDFPVFLKASDHRLYTVFEMDIIGTNKRIEITDRGIYIKIQKVFEDPLFKGYKTLKIEKISEGTYYETMTNAIQEAIGLFQDTQQDTVSSAEDALATVQIIHQIHQYAKKKL